MTVTFSVPTLSRRRAGPASLRHGWVAVGVTVRATSLVADSESEIKIASAMEPGLAPGDCDRDSPVAAEWPSLVGPAGDSVDRACSLLLPQ